MLPLFSEPCPADVRTVGGTPCTGNDLDIFFRNTVFPARVHETVQPLLGFRTVVVQIAGQVYEALRLMRLDHVLRHIVLGCLVIDMDQGAPFHRAPDADRRHAALRDPAAQFSPHPLQDNLVALNQHPVKPFQVRQVENGIFALVLGIVQVFSETVKYRKLYVLMVVHELLQAMQSTLDQFIVPVDRKKGDVIRTVPAFHT